MLLDSPPAIVCEIPSTNHSVASKQCCEKPQKQPISVMAFGMADNNFGVYQENTIVYFYDKVHTTTNAKIIKANMTALQYSSMILSYNKLSSVTVEFNLDECDLTKKLGLYLTHLSSDLHRGTYDSAIRILVNGQVLVEKYVPPSHDWIYDDHFSLAKLVSKKVLRPGANTIEIQLHDDAASNYWIHCIKVM